MYTKSAFFLLLFCLTRLSLGGQTLDTDFAAEINRHREHYKQDFLTNPRAPLRAADTALLDFFPPDPTWRLSARFEATPDAQPFDMPTYSGRTKPFRRTGLPIFK